ncbi:TVP38/TMEM64 family protein [Arthrobacter sp. PAMC25284]|uniref:TVP38/TMEM64 family protein n=1 Tax=Arthrobacter sp. PAMC25284 TaxID=2861279 RepID=UPI001C6336A1|nr:TVP38/TMEM64 family protein [Arthrobacter sp. PAMC25284]QYF90355.1 TVP38/TMEM64 family protein [Arthrobacter sp. PAMC25284]
MTTPEKGSDTPPSTGSTPNARRRAIWRLGLLLVLVAASAIAVLMFPIPPLEEIRGFFGSSGWWGPAVFILGYAALTLAPVPKSVLSVAAGLVFGLAAGLAVVFSAAMLGAVAAFWLGRLLGRDAVERFTGARVGKIDELLHRRGLAAMIGVRLVPVLPFTVINYAAGLTSLRWRPYFLGTAIGILPGTLSYVTLGASGLQPGWQLYLGLGILALLTLAGLMAAGQRRGKAKAADV